VFLVHRWYYYSFLFTSLLLLCGPGPQVELQSQILTNVCSPASSCHAFLVHSRYYNSLQLTCLLLLSSLGPHRWYCNHRYLLSAHLSAPVMQSWTTDGTTITPCTPLTEVAVTWTGYQTWFLLQPCISTTQTATQFMFHLHFMFKIYGISAHTIQITSLSQS
jgi:hypothetical protein